MGQEALCTARFGGQSGTGRALLETDELIFRGAFRLNVPFASVQSVEAVEGALRVCFTEGEAVFELGSKAASWADKIRNPPTLLDKLGVKSGSRIGSIGQLSPAFQEQLKAAGADVADGKPGLDSDLIFVVAENKSALRRIAGLEMYLKPNGGVWVVWPKGQTEVAERDVIEAGRRANLKDVKVVRFSETHSAIKFSIPKSRRQK
jgi:hypothetical protein